MNNKTRNALLLALLLTNGADARRLPRLTYRNVENNKQTVTGGQGALSITDLMEVLNGDGKNPAQEKKVKTLEELRKYAKDALGRNKGLDLKDFLDATLEGIEKDKAFKDKKRLDGNNQIGANTTLSDLKADLDAINKTAGVMKAVMDAKHFDKLLKNSDLKGKVFQVNGDLVDALGRLDNTAAQGDKVKLSNADAEFVSVEKAMKKLKPLTDALAEFVSSNPELIGKDETEKFLAKRYTAERLNNSLKPEDDKAKAVAVYAQAIDTLLGQQVKGMDLFAENKDIEAIKQGEPGKKEVTLLNYMKALAKGDVYTKKNARDLAKVQNAFAEMESKARTSILKRKGLDGDLKTFVKSNMTRVDKNLDSYMNALRNANFEFDADIGNKAFSKAMEELTAEKINKADTVDALQKAFKESFDAEFDKLLNPVKYNIRQFLTYAREKDKFSGLGEKNMGERKNLTKVYRDDAVRNLGEWK